MRQSAWINPGSLFKQQVYNPICNARIHCRIILSLEDQPNVKNDFLFTINDVFIEQKKNVFTWWACMKSFPLGIFLLCILLLLFPVNKKMIQLTKD